MSLIREESLNVTAALCSKGFCCGEMGEYRKVYETYTALADQLIARGYDAEIQYPRELARKCQAKM